MVRALNVNELSIIAGGVDGLRALQIVGVAIGAGLCVPIMGVGNYLRFTGATTFCVTGKAFLERGTLDLSSTLDKVLSAIAMASVACFLFKGVKLDNIYTFYPRQRVAG